MRLSIDHRTVYRFSEPQSRLVQMLRMTPENSHDQTVARWRIDVDCDAIMRRGRDGFGNAITMLYCEGPVAHIEIAVRGEVLTSHSDGVVRGVAEALPPAVFLRETDATRRDAAIAAFAADATADADGRIGKLHRLNRAFNRRFELDRARPQPGLGAGEAFGRARATSRDLAQMFVVAARSLGIPARYVSGYSIVEGSLRPTPHGWAEAHVAELGWVGFDPCTGRSPQEESVRVSAALDASGAAPVAGSRLGEGDEEMDVAVKVSAAQ